LKELLVIWRIPRCVAVSPSQVTSREFRGLPDQVSIILEGVDVGM